MSRGNGEDPTERDIKRLHEQHKKDKSEQAERQRREAERIRKQAEQRNKGKDKGK